jgi:hypothetical protein
MQSPHSLVTEVSKSIYLFPVCCEIKLANYVHLYSEPVSILAVGEGEISLC